MLCHCMGFNQICGTASLYVSHVLCLRRCWCGAASCCRSSPGSAFKSSLYGVALKGACRRELSELVPDHLFGHIDRNKFPSVVDGNRVPDHVGNDRGTPRPRLDYFLFTARIQSFYFVAQVAIDKRPLLR